MCLPIALFIEFLFRNTAEKNGEYPAGNEGQNDCDDKESNILVFTC